MKKFWNFQEKNKDEPVELRLDGNIVDDDDTWIYEWLGMACASPNAFRTQLEGYAGRDISVWIDSYGGSVFAATGIYNALMKHKNTGAKVVTNIDGKAMSAATVPFMAGDERNISPGAIFMVHNPLMGIDAGYASDFRKYADVLDTVKAGILNAYQLGTGLDMKELSDFMDNETYMDAKTAVENHFATAVLFMGQDPTPETVLNFSRMPIYNAARTSMKEFFTIMQNQTSQTQKQEDTNMEVIKNAEELQAQYPEFVHTLVQDAVTNERKRIAALQAMDDPENGAIHTIVQNAIAQGGTAESIQFVVDTIQANTPKKEETVPPSNTGAQTMAQMIKDNMASGAAGVAATGGAQQTEQNENAQAVQMMAAVINRKNGRAQ